MGLIHWWPLNGNLRDYVGCNHLQVKNDNNKLQSNDLGFLGKCWERTATGTPDLLRSTSKMQIFSEMSICAWVYLSKHANLSTANGIITSHDHNTNSGLGIGMYTTDGNNCYVSINAGNGSSRIHSHYWGTTNIKDGWHHICLAYSSDKKIHMYVDGKEDRAAVSYTISFKQDYLDIFNWSTGYCDSPNYRPICKVCDVRVYDHKLSVAEVKELSKGLMIHYAFNDSWNDGATNLLPVDKHTQSNTSAAINVTNGLVNGATYTLSSYITRLSSCTSTNPRMTMIFNYSDGTRDTHSKYNDGGASYPKDGVERFYYITFATNPAKTLKSISGWILDHSSGTGKKMTARNSQLEIGDHPTIYTPTTRENIAFDDSGYGYDAKGYNVELQSTTNVGSYAAKFNGSTSYYEVPVPRSNMFCTPYTLSFWVNPDDDGRAIYFGDYNTVGGVSMNFERKSGGAFRYFHGGSPDKEISGLTSPVGVWTMITVTFDGTTMKFYQNGTEVSNSAYTFTPTITKSSGHMRIGRDSRSDYTALAGYISDFRWYATALSADDVKILYESKAAVDKISNFYTNEFTELNTANVDITKKFTIKTNEIIESQENGFYKDGHMTSNTIYEI